MSQHRYAAVLSLAQRGALSTQLTNPTRPIRIRAYDDGYFFLLPASFFLMNKNWSIP